MIAVCSTILFTDFFMFIALTGGIGCGKSAALQAFAGYGFNIADADRICHEFYTTSEGIAAVSGRWPSVIAADGSIDRQKLGNIVFRDENDLAWLESTVKPYLTARLNELRCSAGNIMVEVPLLFEKNLEKEFDKVISIWSPFALRRQRLAARNWDHAECSRRERLQWSADRKLAAADYGIINVGSLAMLDVQCKKLAEKLLN